MVAIRNSHSPAISRILWLKASCTRSRNASSGALMNNSIQASVPKNSTTMDLLMWVTSSNMTPRMARMAISSRATSTTLMGWLLSEGRHRSRRNPPITADNPHVGHIEIHGLGHPVEGQFQQRSRPATQQPWRHINNQLVYQGGAPEGTRQIGTGLYQYLIAATPAEFLQQAAEIDPALLAGQRQQLGSVMPVLRFALLRVGTGHQHRTGFAEQPLLQRYSQAPIDQHSQRLAGGSCGCQ